MSREPEPNPTETVLIARQITTALIHGWVAAEIDREKGTITITEAQEKGGSRTIPFSASGWETPAPPGHGRKRDGDENRPS